MERHIIRRSKMVWDKMRYEWIISDFSVENLLEGVIESPSFRYLNRDFHLELFHCAEGVEKVRLRLVQSNSDDPLRVKKCDIGFYCSSPSIDWIYNRHTAPVKQTEFSSSIPVSEIKEKCLADNVLRVECELIASKIEHVLDSKSRKKTTENKKTQTRAHNNQKQGHTTLAKNFGNILDNSPFFDVNLKIGGETIPAHKAILAGRSTVFERMFKNYMKESQLNVVVISEMKPTIAKKMLQYIYTGTIGDLTMDEAIDLYVGSDRYDLQELKGWCKEFIVDHIASDHVCIVAVLADMHSDKELAKASRRVFKENSKSILKSEAWRDFRKELQIELLESAMINDNEV